MLHYSANRDIGDLERARGIIGYTAGIGYCKNCPLPTNILWDTDVGEVLACSVECAEEYAAKMK